MTTGSETITYIYMVGTSQDVKTQKKAVFLPPILWIFWTIYIFCFDENYHVFKHLEVIDTMSCGS